ncbi:MAG TPA: hypothetical protein GX528_06950 [Firmicutes bacterium]|nr:hypothetical protein [Bacillota bacterium]
MGQRKYLSADCSSFYGGKKPNFFELSGRRKQINEKNVILSGWACATAAGKATALKPVMDLCKNPFSDRKKVQRASPGKPVFYKCSNTQLGR